MDDVSTRLASNLKRLREAAGLSQKALAEQSGVPRPTIAHLESGQANPTLHVVLKVALALGLSVDQLVDPGEVAIRVLGPKTLPTQRTSRLRRVQMVSKGMLRESAIERITVKVGGRVHLEPSHGAPTVVICEKGTFDLISGALEVPLSPEKLAFIRASTECVARSAGVLYLVSSR